jgi:hypothetical protein
VIVSSYDFDLETQKIINNAFGDISPTNWRSWLDISSREDFEELALRNSDLYRIDDIYKKLLSMKVNPNDFSENPIEFAKHYGESNLLIMCHTSGTTNSNLSALKWFHISKDNVSKHWAPGMQAIFESSGLDSRTSAVIFVPSRIEFDGIRQIEDKKYLSLYSSEFSQRIMLSIIKPNDYLLSEYKYSKNLVSIAKILRLQRISVISAPALTILGWADLDKLKIGIRRSFDQTVQDSETEKLRKQVEQDGLDQAARKIQSELSKKLANATVIFSISSLSYRDWELIRNFMNWKKGQERFTNLYVTSEIGPIAASITNDDYRLSWLNRLLIFPLTLPVIEYKGSRELISRTKFKRGNLLVSRMLHSSPLINIELGDVISIIDNDNGLPKIEGKILRSQFQLQYPIKISNEVQLESNYSIYAGDYFYFPEFEIIQPRLMLNCMVEKYGYESDSFLLIRDANHWNLILAGFDNSMSQILDLVLDCVDEGEFKEALSRNAIKIESLQDNPVNFLSLRQEMVHKVRNGTTPKGILKKWALYVIIPKKKKK